MTMLPDDPPPQVPSRHDPSGAGWGTSPTGAPFDPHRRRLSAGAAAAISLVSAAVTAIVIAVVVMVVWPGVFRLFAPLLCPADRPDAFVVRDTYQPRPGETSITFTMYCVGPSGEVTDVGFIVPFLALTAVVLAVVVLLALVAIGRVRRARRVADPFGSPFT